MNRMLPDGYPSPEGLILQSPVDGLVSGVHLSLPDPYMGLTPGPMREVVRRTIRTLAEFETQTWQWEVESDFPEAALEYGQETKRVKNPRSQRIRDEIVSDIIERAQRGELRVPKVTLWVGQRLNYPVRWTSQGLEEAIAQHLELASQRQARAWDSVQQLLYGVGGMLTRLTPEDYCRDGYRLLNPKRAQCLRTRRFNPLSSLLAAITPGDVTASGSSVVVDGLQYGALELKMPPSESHFGMMQPLLYAIHSGYRVSVTLKPIPKNKFLGTLRKRSKDLDRSIANDPGNAELVATKSKLDQTVELFTAGEVAPMEVHCLITFWDATAAGLEAKADELRHVIESWEGAGCYRTQLPRRSFKLMGAALPGGGLSLKHAVTFRGLDSWLPDLVPLPCGFQGHSDSTHIILYSRDGNPIFIPILLRGVPQHGLFIGPNGCGKSVTLKAILAQIDHLASYVVILEEGMSQAPLTRSYGYEPFVVQPGPSFTINPLSTDGLPWSPRKHTSSTAVMARMVAPNEPGLRAKFTSSISNAIGYLYDRIYDSMPKKLKEEVSRQAMAIAVLKRRGEENFEDHDEVSLFLAFRNWQARFPEQAAELLAAPSHREVYEFQSKNQAQVRNLAFASLAPDQYPTLSALYELFSLGCPDNPETHREYLELANRLKPWLRGGQFGVLFDGPSSMPFAKANRIHLELSKISQSAEVLRPIVAILFFDAFCYEIVTRPADELKFLVIEELAHFLDFEGSEEILIYALEQFRKYRGVLLTTLNSWSRAGERPLLAALSVNIKSFFIFNPGDQIELDTMAHAFSISEANKQALASSMRLDHRQGADRYSEFIYRNGPIQGIARLSLTPTLAQETP